MQYPGIDGFLGSRAPLLLDVAYLLLLATVGLFVWSLHVLLVQQNVPGHRRLHIILSGLFALATLLAGCEFLMHDWRSRAIRSPGEPIPGITYMTLSIHAAFWGLTLVLWVTLKLPVGQDRPDAKSPDQPKTALPPLNYIFWLLLLSLQTFLAVLTGWEFYLLAYCF